MAPAAVPVEVADDASSSIATVRSMAGVSIVLVDAAAPLYADGFDGGVSAETKMYTLISGLTTQKASAAMSAF